MIHAQAIETTGSLSLDITRRTLEKGLKGQVFPVKGPGVDSRPHPQPSTPVLFRMVVDILSDVRQVDFMVALGTHPPLTDEHLLQLVGISREER